MQRVGERGGHGGEIGGGSSRKCEKQKQAEKERDTASLLSRVFDVLTVTC